MNFSLSNDSRALIQQSTGLDNVQQCSTTIFGTKTSTQGNRDYKIKNARDVAPRGSIYLQMGRIIPLLKIKSYLKKI